MYMVKIQKFQNPELSNLKNLKQAVNLQNHNNFKLNSH